MTVFALLGGWTVGRNVVETMGGKIVPASLFSLEVSIAVLFFIGFALFLSNVVGVPASDLFDPGTTARVVLLHIWSRCSPRSQPSSSSASCRASDGGVQK